MSKFITVSEASRIFNLPISTILALGRRGIVQTVDLWRGPRGGLYNKWGQGRIKKWHVRPADVARLIVETTPGYLGRCKGEALIVIAPGRT